MGSSALIKAYVIAGMALVVAVAVYIFARSQPPVPLPRLEWMDGLVAVDSKWLGSAPSFFYTLALGLLIGLVSASAKSASINCLLWTVLALGLELSQLPVLSGPLI